MSDIYPIFDNKPHPITSPYGWRTLNGVRSFHDGIDFSTVIGTPQKPLMGGVIRVSSVDVYGGLYIQVKRDDGMGEWFLHCSRLLKKVGDRVKAGETIALSGNSGNSTAPHTHYGMQSNANLWGSHIDPLPYLTGGDSMYKAGDRVEFIRDTNVRKGNGIKYPINGLAKKGAVGSVLTGEIRKADGYEWMDINITDVQGWCVIKNVQKTTKPKTYSNGSPINPPPPVETCEQKLAKEKASHTVTKSQLNKANAEIKSLEKKIDDAIKSLS